MKNLLIALIVLLSCKVSAQVSSGLNLLYHWDDPALPGSSFYDNTYNEVWGYAAGGREYAIIGSTWGTHIFDVTNPSQAVQVDSVKGKVTGGSIIHRDFKTYQQYLYMVADEGASSLQIADLSYLPDSVHVVYDSDVLFPRSHNLFIDTITARMYVCGGPFNLRIYDISNPVNPLLLLNCTENTVPFWQNGMHIHDLYVNNDTAWLHAGGFGMYVADFSDVQNPVLLGDLTFYPDKGYNHSGWINPADSTYYFADENHGYEIKATDISDISDISVISTFGSGVDLESIPHNLFVKGDLLYVSYYHDGLRVFNIEDPENIWQAGHYDTYLAADHQSYRGAWGVYPYLPSGNILVSDMQSGLYVLGPDPMLGIKEEKRTDLTLYPNPASDQVTVAGLEAMTIAGTLTDSFGRVVTTIKIQRGKFNIGELPPGMYYLLFHGQFEGSGKKLIISR